MTFVKGENTEQLKGVAQREKNKEDWWAFLASGGLRKYNELMDILANGEEINKWHQQFLDRSERNFPYIKARKTDVTSDGKELSQVLVKFIDGKDN